MVSLALTLGGRPPTGADAAVVCNHHGLGGAGATDLAQVTKFFSIIRFKSSVIKSPLQNRFSASPGGGGCVRQAQQL